MMKKRVAADKRARWTDLFTELMMGLFVVSSHSVALWGLFLCLRRNEKPLYVFFWLPPPRCHLGHRSQMYCSTGDPELKPALPLHHLETYLLTPTHTHTRAHTTSRHLSLCLLPFFPPVQNKNLLCPVGKVKGSWGSPTFPIL